MDNIRTPSTPALEKRERKGKDSALEDLLEFWGAWRAQVISGLSASSQSPVNGAIELYRPYRNPKKIYPHQTRVVEKKIPKYWPHHRMALINQAVWELKIIYQEILIYKYEECWETKDFIKEFNWDKDKVYTELSEARKSLKKHPTIKSLLGRN